MNLIQIIRKRKFSAGHRPNGVYINPVNYSQTLANFTLSFTLRAIDQISAPPQSSMVHSLDIDCVTTLTVTLCSLFTAESAYKDLSRLLRRLSNVTKQPFHCSVNNQHLYYRSLKDYKKG